MDIGALTVTSKAQAAETAKAVSRPDDSFTKALHTAQAPPGPEPPPGRENKTREVEQKTEEPNAQSKTPDPLSKTADTASQASANPAVLPGVTLPLVSLQNSVMPAQDVAAPAQDDQTGIKLSAEALPQLDGVTIAAIEVRSTETAVTFTPSEQSESQAELSKSLPATDLKVARAEGGTASGKDAKVESRKGEEKREIVAQGSPSTGKQQVDPKQPDKSSAPGSPTPIADATHPTKEIPTPTGTAKPPLKENASAQEPVTSGCSAQEHGPTSSDDSATGNAPKDDNRANGPVTAEPSRKPGLNSQSSVPHSTEPQHAQNRESVSKAEPLAVNRTMQNVRVMKEISDRFELVNTIKRTTSVTVQLEPDQGQGITLVVQSGKGRVDAQFLTDNPSLRNALQQNRGDLNSSLGNKGLSLGQMSVGNGQSHSGRERGTNQSFTGQTTKTSGQTLASTRGSTDRGVDLWI